jgi:hypothetical protein
MWGGNGGYWKYGNVDCFSDDTHICGDSVDMLRSKLYWTNTVPLVWWTRSNRCTLHVRLSPMRIPLGFYREAFSPNIPLARALPAGMPALELGGEALPFPTPSN